MQIMPITIHKRGEKLLIELPPELLSKLGWGVGDIVSVDQVEDGLKISRATTAHDRAMQIARKGMDKYRKTFEILAKS